MKKDINKDLEFLNKRIESLVDQVALTEGAPPTVVISFVPKNNEPDSPFQARLY